jgi:hypothetical protein
MYTNPGPYTSPGPLTRWRSAAAHASYATTLTVPHPWRRARATAPGAQRTLDSPTRDGRPSARSHQATRSAHARLLNGQQPRKLLQQRPAVARGSRGSCRCEEAASGGRCAASGGGAALPGRSSTQMKATPDLRKERARDPVSRATQKPRAAWPHTSPSEDIGCCSCAELAMPEEQRSCQHSSTEHVVRIKFEAERRACDAWHGRAECGPRFRTRGQRVNQRVERALIAERQRGCAMRALVLCGGAHAHDEGDAAGADLGVKLHHRAEGPGQLGSIVGHPSRRAGRRWLRSIGKVA